MKRFLTLCVILATLNAFATGTFLFSNFGALAITNNLLGGIGPTANSANGFYFGLFIAPPGTTDPATFSFSGSYATNATTTGGFGRLGGGLASAQGMEPGDQVSTLVRGWSSSLGHDWTDIKNQLDFGWGAAGFYGESFIGIIHAGGDMYPPYPVLGQLSGQIPGITLLGVSELLSTVPEPSVSAIALVGLIAICRHRRDANRA